MTKAQEVKKAIKGCFKDIKCVGGRGTASGWVSLSFSYPKQKDCDCEYLSKEHGYRKQCSECENTKSKAKSEFYQKLKSSNVELYSYYPDDGYNSSSNCIHISINLV